MYQLLKIPGYLQGFRFADDPAYYDSAAKRFIDQAGYDHLGNGLQIDVGTPSFTTVNGRQGMVLDNTVQGRFLPATPWDGACIAVMKPNMAANGTIYPVLVGQSGTLTNNGSIRITRASPASYLHRLASGGVFTACTASYTDDGVKVSAWALSQEARNGYSTKDGITVTAVAGPADIGNGNGLAFGSLGNAGVPPADVRGQKARFGNIDGTIDSVAASSNTLVICELHFFKGNPLVDALAETKDALDALRAYYGATTT